MSEMEKRVKEKSMVRIHTEAKLVLGIVSLVVGMPALAFAVFGWSEAAFSIFSVCNRYVCMFASCGAAVSGILLISESLRKYKWSRASTS